MNKSSKREFYKKIYNDTLEYIDELSLTSKLSFTEKLKMKSHDIILSYEKKYNKTTIQVLNQDVIKSTIDLHTNNNNQKKNILVLNLASKKRFGGGVINGAMAQEEELFRKSSYGKHSGSELYPLKLDEFTFTPSVYIVKDELYNRLESDKIFPVDMLAISALANPILFDEKLNESDYNLTFEKIETIFKYALQNGNEQLVLGALGCGVFNNPPLDIIEMYNTCLKKYNGYFANIVFSVKSINDDNFKLFNEYIIR